MFNINKNYQAKFISSWQIMSGKGKNVYFGIISKYLQKFKYVIINRYKAKEKTFTGIYTCIKQLGKLKKTDKLIMKCVYYFP